MADPLKQICDALGVCTEEALFYLEGFRWDLNAAMEACRSKTLPSPSLTAQPPSSKNERSAAEEQMRNEKIATFLEFSGGSSAEDAIKYLSDYNWNLDLAARSFYAYRHDQPEKKSEPVPLSHDGHTVPWYLHGFSGDEGSSGTMQDVLSKVPQFRKTSTDLRIGSSPSASTPRLEAKPLVAPSQAEESENPTQTLPLKGEESAEVKEEHIGSFVKMTGATREDAIAYLDHFKWNINEAVKFFEDYGSSGDVISALRMSLMENRDASGGPTETQRSLEKAGEGDVTVAIPGMANAHVKIQESSSPTQTSEGSGTSVNQLLISLEHEELVDVFVEAADGVVTRDVAAIYLTHNNWNVNKAFSCLMDEEKTTQVQASEEGETRISSSSSDADPTETGSVTVAVPEDASSKVDENVKDNKDVEEDLGTELSAVLITTTTIELKILLDNGESGKPLWILVRSNQTVRDIRNRIDAFRPDDKRDYYLKSDTGVEYRDWDTTVHSITSGSRGSTTLHQLYST